MPRIHLFEFEDLSWFPSSLRNYGTDFLQFLSNQTKMYKPVVPVILKGLDAAKCNQIIDLGSGGGGGLLWLNQALKEERPDLKITLTDYYPNLNAFKRTRALASNFDFITASIDARNVPQELKGLRTQFLSLHHFKPKDAQLILQNTVDHQRPIAIFEGQERSFPSILAMIFSPVSVLFTTPFIRPFSIGRVLFTYLIPIVPIFVMWDGIVSSLRTYSIEEMNDLVSKLKKSESFEWEIDKVKSGPSTILYLLGTPKAS